MTAEAATQPSHEHPVHRPVSYYVLLILWEKVAGPRWGSGLVTFSFNDFSKLLHI